MVFEDNNKKNYKNNNGERIVDDNYSSNNMDLNILEDIDLNSIKKEMEDIENFINNNSSNLSEEKKIELQNELELISNILNMKLQSFVDDDSEVVSDSGDDLVDEVVSDSGDDSNFWFDDLVLDDEHNYDVDSDNSLLLNQEDDNQNLDDDLILDDDINDKLDSSEDRILEDNDYKNNNSDENINSDISVDEALDNLIEDYSDEIAIKVENVSMDFKVSKDKIDTLKEFFIRTIKRNKSPVKTVHALKNISFEITKGDRVGIIGFNGAGKSTLLKLLSSVYYPTEGTIETKGKIAPLLELGAGFDNNYTGKDNIFLNAAFLGYSEEFLKGKYDEIVEFSELGDAINYHVKTYSSGMRAKLGFSIATIVEPDILILDEILSVGDIKFRRKSADKIKSLINSGITVLIVSHTVGQIRDLCNKAIWIDNGELVMMGDVNEVCDEYVKASTQATSEQLENLDFN